MASWANHDDVLTQLRAAGLLVELPLRLATSDRSVRCLIDGGDREKRGWYRLHEWQMEPGVFMLVGAYGIFRGSRSDTWKVELTKACASCGAEVGLRDKKCQACGQATFVKREFSDEQKAAFKARMEEDKRRAAEERGREIQRASRWATSVWRSSTEATPGGHAYLVRKKLSGTGGARIFSGIDGITLEGAEQEDYRYLKSFAGSLVVPMCDGAGAVYGVQFIAEKPNPKTGRDKINWPPGHEAAGHYWLLGASPRRMCLIVEGFATGMTLFEATGQPVAIAFSAGNLLPVAKVINARTKRRAKILIGADDDWIQKCRECGVYTPVAAPTCAHCGKPHRTENAGVARSAEAALALDNVETFVPVFAQPRPTDRKGPTDFNDLASIEGQQVVIAQFEQRLDALGWRDLASTPTPAISSPSRQPGGAQSGEGGRRDAVSVMLLDDAVERFLPIDDGTGDYVWDHWTNKIAKRSQMIALLPAGVRGDDLKRHDVWRSRGAVYLDEIGFDPAGDDPKLKLNTWQGWPMKPKPGSCERLLELLEYLCSKDSNPAALFHWIQCWMAWPLQNPGGKMHSALIMHGPQGTGKSTIFQVLSRIYGDYATVLNQRGLEDKFNADWSDSKLLIVAEEVINRKELRTIGGELKDLVTGEWIRVNPKGIAAYRQRNHLNVVFLSNDYLPMVIESDDRRHCVVYTPPELGEKYYDEVFTEIENGGVAALYHHLLHLDLTGFHPRKRPPMTDAKQDLMHLSAPSESRFLAAWIAVDTDWPLGPCEAKDLYAAYLRWCRANGESYPKASVTFYATLAHLPGWDKKQCRIYRNLNSSESDRKHIVFPPKAALVAANAAMPEGALPIAWLTESVFRFANAINVGKSSE